VRPDLNDLVPVLAMLAAVLLLLPKRDMKGIAARLRATAQGERDYVFGPPAGLGPLSVDFVERWLQLVRRELPRAVELGVPLHVLAVLIEARGAERRLAREAAWGDSTAGLLFEHLLGRITEIEFRDRLREGGFPLPASKLRWTNPTKLSMPSMIWRVEWERHLESLQRHAEPPPAQKPTTFAKVMEVAEPLVTELEIQTLGRISICSAGEDFAPRLLHRPALAFTWLYLLAREGRQPNDRVTRAVLADELFPGIDPEQQRRKLRQRLNELSNDLPRALASRITTDGEYVGLDLTGSDFDVRRLLALAEEVRAIDGPLSGELLGQVEKALRPAAEEFLPGWEEIERRGTDRGSDAERVVSEVRDRVVAAHLSLVDALARTHLARQQPGRAIPRLEEALRHRPDREQLARRLADAYEMTGQTRGAARLREEYGFREGP
jgi:DNA-binding SARP family transcriptional activator